MAYEHIENIRDSGDEKIALLLSIKNILGILALGMPAYLITAGMSGLLRIVILIVAGVLGFLLTVDAGGMMVASRSLWQLRGIIRLRLQGDRIEPSSLADTSAPPAKTRVLPLVASVRPLSLTPRQPAHTEASHADHPAQ